jgi:hypothetical protein
MYWEYQWLSNLSKKANHTNRNCAVPLSCRLLRGLQELISANKLTHRPADTKTKWPVTFSDA